MTDNTKPVYEAVHCADIPTDCCDYAVISHEKGREVCRVWEQDDAKKIALLLNAPTPTAEPAGEEPVEWQWRHKRWTGGEWRRTENKDRNSPGAEYRPLYARPATPTNPERLVKGWAMATAWHKYGIAWKHLEETSKRELLDEARAALSTAPLKE